MGSRLMTDVAPNQSSCGLRWFALTGLVLLCLSGPLLAEAPAVAVTTPAMQTKPATSVPAESPVSSPLTAVTRDAEPETLFVENRAVVEFRASWLGYSPEMRADRARGRIYQQLEAGARTAGMAEVPQGYAITLDDVLVFIVLHEDADLLTEQPVSALATQVVAALQRATDGYHERAGWRNTARAAALVLAASVITGLIIWSLGRLRTVVEVWMASKAIKLEQLLPVKAKSIVSTARLVSVVRFVLIWLYRLICLLLLHQWLVVSLARFSYTKPWSEQINGVLITLVLDAVHKIAAAVPDLLVAALIFYLAKLLNDFQKSLLARVENRSLSWSWLEPDSVKPTRQLISIGIWLMALAMAYPYFPGSSTAAFQGVSLLVGLMVSVGGSGLVSHAAAGLVVMYTRTIRVGEYARIGDKEGTIEAIGLFNTRIRTGLGEELTIPNSLIQTSVTVNYSRAIVGQGFVVDTTVTIGYDTPWRMVHAMLIEAAGTTPGILAHPEPRVFQTELGDFYIHYRLVAQADATEATKRMEILNRLHGAIQDIFNRNGVQIMSPHYLGDPKEPKIVPAARWSPPLVAGQAGDRPET